MDRSALVVYNPMAGSCAEKTSVQSACRYWQERGWQVQFEISQKPGHAVDLARRAVEKDYRMVFAAGGDGTVGQVAEGLAGSDTALGILPVGTANAFAKLIGLVPTVQIKAPDLQQTCHRYEKGRVQTIDLGRAFGKGIPKEGMHFTSWAGIGLDSYVIDHIEPRPKWIKRLSGSRFGWLSYLLLGTPPAMRFPGIQAQVKVDSQVVNGTFVLTLVSKSRLYGGGLVQLSHDVHLDDGILDVWLFKGRMFSQTLRYAVQLLAERHLYGPGIIHLNGRHVEIRTWTDSAIQLDGDAVGYAPLTVTVEPQALKLLAPEGAPSDLFSMEGVPFEEFN